MTSPDRSPSAERPVVGVIMGSRSDLSVMQACIDQLDELGVPSENIRFDDFG